MPFISMDFDKIQETPVAPNGMYDLVVTEAEEAVSKNGKPGIKMRLEVEGADYQSIMNWQSLPQDDDEPEAAKFKALMLKRLSQVFDHPIPADGFDPAPWATELVGKRGKAELKQEIYNDQPQSKLVLPQLRTSGTVAGKGTPPKKR